MLRLETITDSNKLALLYGHSRPEVCFRVAGKVHRRRFYRGAKWDTLVFKGVKYIAGGYFSLHHVVAINNDFFDA